MRLVIQRVKHALVDINSETVGKINKGLLVLAGFKNGDEHNEKILELATNKLLNLRIFPDQKGRLHHSVLKVSGQILIVPQFTLYADTSKGRRPEFFNALEPNKAKEMFLDWKAVLEKNYPNKIQSGVFGAKMDISLCNWGPVTIILDF